VCNKSIELKNSELREMKQKLGDFEVEKSKLSDSLQNVNSIIMEQKVKLSQLEDELAKESVVKEKLLGKVARKTELQVGLSNLQDKTRQIERDMKQLMAEITEKAATNMKMEQLLTDTLERQRKEELIRLSNSAEVLKLNPTEVLQDLQEAKNILEPLEALKMGLADLLKYLNGKIALNRGKDLQTICDAVKLQDVNIQGRVENTIVEPLLQITKIGFTADDWWFTTGHFWKMLQEMAYLDSSATVLREMMLVAYSTTSEKCKLSGAKWFDCCTKTLFLEALNHQQLLPLVQLISRHPEVVRSYYSKNALLRNPNDMDTLLKLAVPLSKLPLHVNIQRHMVDAAIIIKNNKTFDFDASLLR
jgi:hypothetical protein